MNSTPHIANSPRGQMTDEQLAAMWAKRRGGGGGSRSGGGPSNTSKPSSSSASPSGKKPDRGQYIPANESAWWSATKAAASGFAEGITGGATILADKLTFGAIDALSRAADSYQGWEYDVSRTSATVARESLLAAGAMGALSKAGKAWQGFKSFAGLGGKSVDAYASGLAAVGGFATKSAIEDYRDANPTIDPYSDKALAMASTLAGYVGSIGAVGSGTKALRALGRAIPAGAGKSLADLTKSGMTKLDNFLGSVGSAISTATGKLTPAGARALSAAHSSYSKVADFTGSSIKDLVATPGAVSKLRKAKTLAADAADYAARGHSSMADQLTKASKALSRDAKSSLAKSAYVATGLAGVTARDELSIKHYKDQHAEAQRAGTSNALPRDKERGLLGTLAAAAAGTLGNPVEKFLRPGLETRAAEQGVYRANYEAIEAARASGELSASQADAALKKLAANKPWKMDGNTLWQFAPASAAFGNWKIYEAIDKAKRSTTDQRPRDSYIDGDTVSGKSGNKYRLVDINAPEVAHPENKDPNHPERTYGEPLGVESAQYADRILRPGQYYRVVEDSNPSAGGETYGRQVRTIETLPKPFDQLLRIPYVGKVIPAQEFQEKMIRGGLADIDYRELTKYKGDNLVAHDKARAKAQAEKKGIWSDEAQRAYSDFAATHPAYKPWVGTEKTVAERTDDYYRRVTGAPKPQNPMGDLMLTGGMGLMATGNTGVFNLMPRSGSAVAQAWNALLSAGGAIDYNARARNNLPRETRTPAEIRSDYRRELDERASALGLR